MFDTRSGFWLMVGIAVAGLLATGAVDRRSPPTTSLTYDNFAGAIGVPMTILLPVVAILVGDRRVEPARRPHDVHPGAAPRPGDPRQARRHAR